MSTTTSFLDRMLQPVTDAMPVEFARKLVSLRADDDLMAQIEPLREKASCGSLSVDEESEYKEFVEAVDVISILQAKARKVLAAHVSDA